MEMPRLQTCLLFARAAILLNFAGVATAETAATTVPPNIQGWYHPPIAADTCKSVDWLAGSPSALETMLIQDTVINRVPRWLLRRQDIRHFGRVWEMLRNTDFGL